MEERMIKTGYTARRLLAQDLPLLEGWLAGRLSANARFSYSQLACQQREGGWYGLFLGRRLCAAALFLPLAARCVPARGLYLSGRRNGGLLLPVWTEAAKPALAGFLSFVQDCAGERAALFLLPVKNGGLELFLAPGMLLTGLCPLWKLTPCWLLEPGSAGGNGRLFLPVSDSLRTGKALAEGWRGAAVQNGLLLMERALPE